MNTSSREPSTPAGAAQGTSSLAPRESDLPPHDAFTVVFHGNLRAYPSNPYHADTPFGRAGTIALGDVVAERDEFEARTEDLLEALTEMLAAFSMDNYGLEASSRRLKAKSNARAAMAEARKALSDGSEARTGGEEA